MKTHTINATGTIKPPLFLLFIIFICCYHSIFAQTDSLISQKEFSKGKIIKKERTGLYDGKNLILNSNNVIFLDKKTNQQITLPLSEVEFISARYGNNANRYGWGGAGFTAMVLALTLASPDVKIKSNEILLATGTMIGGVAAGYGIGYLIGLLVPKNEIVYKKGKFYVSINNQKNFNYYSNLQSQILAIQINF
jgi:hypothetical protein